MPIRKLYTPKPHKVQLSSGKASLEGIYNQGDDNRSQQVPAV